MSSLTKRYHCIAIPEKQVSCWRRLQILCQLYSQIAIRLFLKSLDLLATIDVLVCFASRFPLELETQTDRKAGPSLNPYNDVPAIFKAPPRETPNSALPAEIMLLIDSGYSHTTITPLLHGNPFHNSIRRLDVGGKIMTNYLTRLLSLRQYDMRNETYLVNEIKEACCYISRDFKGDLERTWKGTIGDRKEAYATGGGIAKDYVLPDYHNLKNGFMRDHDPGLAARVRKMAAGKAVEAVEDVITLRNERFTVPELLFNPMDIGLRQPGLAQLVMQSLSELPVGLWPGLLANVVVVGGNSNIDGFIHRLQAEIMTLAPSECLVRVARPNDPIVSTWQGGANLARDEDKLSELSVTRQEYEEFGAGWVARKFGGR